MELHVHTNASLLAVGATLSQNVIGKSDQPIMYVSRLLNKAEQNYSTIEKEVLTTIFALHKFRHYLLGNKFVFYVDHMALVYLVSKPQVLGIIVKWLLLFLEYDFIIMYKLSRIHVIVAALLKLLDNIHSTSVPNKTIDVSLFYIECEWLNHVKEFLRT